jgi:hypothetical protein
MGKNPEAASLAAKNNMEVQEALTASAWGKLRRISPVAGG